MNLGALVIREHRANPCDLGLGLAILVTPRARLWTEFLVMLLSWLLPNHSKVLRRKGNSSGTIPFFSPRNSLRGKKRPTNSQVGEVSKPARFVFRCIAAGSERGFVLLTTLSPCVFTWFDFLTNSVHPVCCLDLEVWILPVYAST